MLSDDRISPAGDKDRRHNYLSLLKFVRFESTDAGICKCCSAAKVRVTFFQAEKPLNVTSPEPNEDQAPTDPDMSATIVTTLPDGHPAFHRQER